MLYERDISFNSPRSGKVSDDRLKGKEGGVFRRFGECPSGVWFAERNASFEESFGFSGAIGDGKICFLRTLRSFRFEKRVDSFDFDEEFSLLWQSARESRDPPKRGIEKQSPLFLDAFEKPDEVIFPEVFKNGIFGMKCLKEEVFFAYGAPYEYACDREKYAERAFIGVPSRHTEERIRVHHSNEGNARQVPTVYSRLGCDEHIAVSMAELLQFGECARTFFCFGIVSYDTNSREFSEDIPLDAFGSDADMFHSE